MCIAVIQLALASVSARATAQCGVASDSARAVTGTSDSSRYDPTPWVTRRDAAAFGAAAVATVALAPLDRPVSSEFDEPHWKQSRPLHHLARDVAFLGGDGPFVVSAALYVGSTFGDAHGLRRFAMHNMEAIALASAIAGIGKGIAGRALPGVKTRHAFEFGRGFHDGNGPFVSFPSGHTAAAFAFATTVAAEVERADSTQARRITVIAFGTAAAVGVARVIQRVHWPSDLPIAAVIGTWSGRTIQRHASDRGELGSLVRGLTVGLGPNRRTQLGWSSVAAFGVR